ncbi:MAG: hypothetical protein H0W98_04015 [Chloroflexi bacterium]|nr:hypothetical protein [Chloroflexota bacterium]
MKKRDEPRAVEIGEQPSVPVGPGARSSFDATRLDFGHHTGRTIRELVELDPDYLRWLARHPSGARYRVEIAREWSLAVPHAGDWER